MGMRNAALLVGLACLLSTSTFAASFGRTAGQFAVSPIGSAQYTIPIWTPPGVGSVHPNLALTYDSNSGNGILGAGWSLVGQSSITRCNQTFAQDGAPAPITLTTADRFCLDGARLRLTSSDILSTYGTASTTYQTEIADFSQITASPTLTGTGPAYFTVQGKNGLTYEYGNTADSQVLVPGNPNPYVWALDKVTDRAGNQMTYSYTQTDGTFVLASIQYTAPSGSSAYLYQVVFTYGKLSLPQNLQYIAGSLLSQSQQLGSVEVFLYNTTTQLRNYTLAYAPSGTTTVERLYSVKECGGSDGSDCLLPTIVKYQPSMAGVANPTSASGGTTNTTIAYNADMNGDGKQDLIYAVGNGANLHYWVQLSTGTGYGTPIDTGIITTQSVPFLIDNFDGTLVNQILTPINGFWYAYKWNPTTQAFASTYTGIALVNGVSYASADIDGDGRPDLAQAYAAPDGSAVYVAAQFNTTLGGTVSFGSPTLVGTLAGQITAQVGNLYGDNAGMPTPLKRMDFDGDGRSDLLVTVNYARPARHATTFEVMSRGSGLAVFGQGFSAGFGVAQVLPVNWNDDACTDLVFSGTDQGVWISQCNGTSSEIVSLTALPLVALDWDGDGRTDLLSNVNGTLQVFRSTGSGVSSPVDTGYQTPTSIFFYFATDIDGDGLDDIVFAGATGAIDFGLHNDANSKPDLAASFTDGYGVAFSPTYASLSDSGYTHGTTQTWPQQDYTGPIYVVPSFSMTDGIGGVYDVTYSYGSAVTNLQGRGFAGFTQIKSNDSRTGFWELRNFSTVYPTAGVLTSDTLTQSNTAKSIRNINYIDNALSLDSTTYNQRYYLYYGTVTDKKYEYGGSLDAQLISTTVSTQNSPDNYGNFATVASTITDNDPNSPYHNNAWTTSTAYSISPDHGVNWCLNLPTEVDVTNTAPGSGSPYMITRHTKYLAPDYPNCRQTEQIIEAGGTYQVDTKYGYDSFGNLNNRTVTGQGMSARATTISWNTNNGQFPISITNALNQVSQVSFDPNTGKLSTIVDPNGIATAWTYDSFGRKSKETRPDRTSTTWAYNSCATAGCVNTNNQMTVLQTIVNTNSTALNYQNIYLDTFDRILVTSKQMYNGAYDRNEVQYDNLGNIKQQLAPCTFVSCTQYWTVNSFDYLNRLIASQRPINSGGGSQTTNIGYAGRTTTTTDPNGVMSSVITKVTGQLGRTTDANGYYVSFDHDAFGALLSSKDSLSHTLKSVPAYAYGINAFPQSSTDIDMGSATYTFDALGELTAYTDAKGQSFSTTYDALSRPKVRTEPDLTTTWTWGTSASSHNIGKLASVSSSASAGTYSESYGFDSAGRIVSKIVAIPGAGSNEFDYFYDPVTELLNTLTYPASYPSTYRLKLLYSYHWGILNNITDANVSSTTYYVPAVLNPRGQIIAEKTSDSSADQTIHMSKNYDAVTGWMTGSYAGVGNGSGTSLQNEAYLYDKLGNLTQRQDNNAGLTENFYYDKLSRLYYSTLGSSTNLQMCYDNTGGSCTENMPGMGNITSRSDIAGGAAWTYDPSHVHEVTQAGSASYTYTYDANGNAKTRNGSTIGWTSYNYPSSVSTSTESASFDYGPNRQRWHMAYTGPSGTENTYYATPHFEIVVTSAGTDYRHYIYVAGAPKLVISRTTAGAVNVRSLLTNHQGSISSIVANSTGTNLVSESFTAFGNRREASTWNGAPSSGELNTMNGVTREGYTFQTVLGSMGLNHMNGRIADSVTGRFLSADPIVSDPRNTQTHNRYSFVTNNPLSYNDPTGFCKIGQTNFLNLKKCGSNPINGGPTVDGNPPIVNGNDSIYSLPSDDGSDDSSADDPQNAFGNNYFSIPGVDAAINHAVGTFNGLINSEEFQLGLGFVVAVDLGVQDALQEPLENPAETAEALNPYVELATILVEALPVSRRIVDIAEVVSDAFKVGASYQGAVDLQSHNSAKSNHGAITEFGIVGSVLAPEFAGPIAVAEIGTETVGTALGNYLDGVANDFIEGLMQQLQELRANP